MDKDLLRKQFRKIRKENYSLDKCRKITQNVINSKEYLLCDFIFTYLSYNNEVDTYEIINQAFRDNKRVALPYVTNIPHKMVFIEIESIEGLVKNKYGIPEPIYDEEKIVYPNEKTLILVPGLAFNPDGGRLGYGGGYYDSYLFRQKSMCNMGLCFGCQLTNENITENFDVKLDKIIWEV